MLGVIYINIYKEVNFSFGNPNLEVIRSMETFEVFDIDNFSEIPLMNYAQDFIGKNDKVVLIIEIEEGAKEIKILPIINKALKKGVQHVFLKGEHPIISKLLVPFKHVVEFETSEELKKGLSVIA